MKLVRTALILLTIASACTASSVGTTFPDIPDPTTPLAEEYVELVAFEALWKCDIQRYAFEDLETIETALSERLADSAISSEEYDQFKSALDLDDELRLHTRLAFREVCLDVDG